MRTAIFRRTFLIVAFLLSAGIAPTPTSARLLNTITLISGNGPVGTLDPDIEFSDDEGATWQSATIVPPDITVGGIPVNYDVIPGTHHVARNGNGDADEASTTIYRTFFTLPAAHRTPVLRARMHADDAGFVVLNGNLIGGHRSFNKRNFSNPPELFLTTNPTDFTAGQNLLEFYVANEGGPSVLDYKTKITYLLPPPQPNTLLPDLPQLGNPCANPTHIGTDGDEIFFLEGGPFIVDGKGGNDVIITGDKDDIVCGGDGDDTIVTHDGNDRIYGGRGNDTIEGRSGNDRIYGQRGDDIIDGGDGFDICSGGNGSDTIENCP